ncbi:acid protease [Lactarius sanguifluus]|nr:acid protease [Lactarius sanguifluus]
MRALTVFLITALPFILSVLAHPRRHNARSVGFAIPISRRNEIRSADGVVHLQRLQANTQWSIYDILVGFLNFMINTGETHPLADGLDLSHILALSKRATGSVPLVDDSSFLWYGTIQVGTPSESFTVDFDTGSSDIFLPSTKCDTNCDGHTLYDPSASASAVDRNKTFKLRYGDGSAVSGEQYRDTVSIAHLTAYNQTLGAALTYSSGFSESNFAPDGLVGLGYQSISAYNSPPLFQTLVAQGRVTLPQFAFKLSNTGAELFLGGTNSNLYNGSFTYVPVTKQGYWQTILTGIFINDCPDFLLNQTSVIIDTGTTLIIGNENDVKAIYAKIPGSQPGPDSGLEEGFFTIPCNSGTVVSFEFGLKRFPVSWSTFNLGQVSAGSDLCVGGIVYYPSLDFLDFWIIGDVFLQNVYTVFDVGENLIGFADLASPPP